MPTESSVERRPASPIQAVILAAGAGSRIRDSDPETPKPLRPVLGMPLVERAIRAALAGGCEEIIVVVGFEAERTASFVRSRFGERVRCVVAEDWHRGNGASLRAAGPLLAPGPFLVLMADHIVSPAFIAAATATVRREEKRLRDGAVFLWVDSRLESVHDLEEATKVTVHEGRVQEIGKHLTHYDGVDTGVFAGSHALLQTLTDWDSEPASSGREETRETVTLTEAARRLASSGRLWAIPAEQGFWIDVDDAVALREAEHRLLQDAADSSGDGPVARHLNRRLSKPLTALLARTRATPDQVTWTAFAMSVAAGICFALGLPFWGGILTQCSSVIDGVDGELARLRYETRPEGAFLDTILDRYADAVVIAGLALGTLVQGIDPRATLALGLAAMAGAPLSALIKDRIRVLGIGAANQGDRNRRYRPLQDDPPLLRWLPANRDGRAFSVFLWGILGLPWLALLTLAIFSHALAIGRSLYVRRSRDLSPTPPGHHDLHGEG